MKESERRKIVEQAKENFWNQKSEEFSNFLLWCFIIVFIVFVVIPCLGLITSVIFEANGLIGYATDPNWSGTLVFSSDKITHYAGSYLEYMSVGLFSLIIIALISGLIYLICIIIKQFIDCNIETAFNRAIDQVHATKSKQGGKK